MAYIPGYTYDIYLSYSHIDNLRSYDQHEGWIERFYQDLVILMARRIGQLDKIKIWWDTKKLSGSQIFDPPMEEAINQSAIILCITSPSYLNSAYCKKELELFYKKAQLEPAGLEIGKYSRVFNVLLSNIPYTKWPKELNGTTGFPFHDAVEVDDLGDPLDIGSPPYMDRLKDLRDAIIRTIDEFPKQQISASFDKSSTETIEISPLKKHPAGESQFVPLNEGKLILVGRGEVGKTSLVNRLVNKSFRVDESKTNGISVTNWSVQCDSTTIKLHIWDFGGQEIMHATHQFFLTDSSLYLIVINGREGGVDEDVEYWLKHIEAFGNNSTVIIVQNKINQHPFDLNYRGLITRYPQIAAFVKTDCRDDFGLNKLLEEIKKELLNMPEVLIQLPSSWFEVKHRLETMGKNFIGYGMFQFLCFNEGIVEEADHEKLSWILHRLGIILNYNDDSRLRETSVLKPEWVTEGIYKILNAPIVTERKGELYLSDLGELLPKNVYPLEKHFFLLELMRKFSLCFAFPDETSRYLIPELLGKEEPEETQDFSPPDCLCFEYHYAILPEGIIPRFIVRTHILSKGQKRWRSGVILAHEECKALVKTNLSNKKVIVWVKGEDTGSRRRLLAIIRYDLDRINSEFSGLAVHSMVPLAAYPEVAVDYKKLVEFERLQVKEFPELVAEKKLVMIQVRELLNGIDLETQRPDPLEIIAKTKSVFLSYSHKDENLRDELEVHLKLLQRQGIISTWYDRKILPGSEWNHEIHRQLERANIILLLVSADFIASDYCWDNEVKLSIERHKMSKAIVIPVVLRSCDWQNTLFGKLQALPKNIIPVTTWLNRDEAWTDVAKGLRQVIEKMN